MRTDPRLWSARGSGAAFFAPGEVLGRRGEMRYMVTYIELAIHRPVYHLRYGRPTTVHSKRPTLKSGSSCSGPTDDVAVRSARAHAQIPITP